MRASGDPDRIPCWRFIFMLGRCPDVPPASELGDHSYVAYLLDTERP
jgi:hypothetical protein